jgi:hypothetical protein
MLAPPSFCAETGNDSPSDEMWKWEDKLTRCGFIRRIDKELMPSFIMMLKSCRFLDTFKSSAAYYMMTGRRGIWLASGNSCSIPFCWHPNKSKELLIFPPLGSNDVAQIGYLLNDLPCPPSGLVRLARLEHPMTEQAVKALTNNKNFPTLLRAGETVEKLLDWCFPAQIIDTKKMVEHRGTAMRQVRWQITKAGRLDPNIQPLSSRSQFDRARVFTRSWARSKASTEDEFEQLVAPHDYLLDMASVMSCNLKGMVCTIDGAVAGYALWDEGNESAETGNIFACLSSSSYYGLSTYIISKVCEWLLLRQIRFANLGGSETNKLDRYKMSLQPAKSVKLSSVVVTYVTR